MPVRAGSGLSELPDARAAALEAAADARAGLDGAAPDLAVLFVAGDHVEAIEEVVEAVDDALGASVLIGCGASGVVGDRRELETGSAVSVWTAALDGGRVEAFAADAMAAGDAVVLGGLPDAAGANAVLLLADPLRFPVDDGLRAFADTAPAVPVIGGLASGRRADGSIPLLLGDAVADAAAVGVTLHDVDVLPCVSQGATPVGPEIAITAADGHIVLELAGRPAVATLQEAIDALDPSEKALVAGGLLLGIVVETDKPEYEQGDFLVRGVLGVDPESGAIAVGADVREGQVVRLHARDAGSADRDLRELLGLHRVALGSGGAAGALVFACNGRGLGMFGTPDHDATVVAEELGDPPVAGLFAAGEIGPVGGQSFMHSFTATMAVFART